jgi:hypothetical protein
MEIESRRRHGRREQDCFMGRKEGAVERETSSREEC